MKDMKELDIDNLKNALKAIYNDEEVEEITLNPKIAFDPVKRG
jgi:hypothetical protein